MIKVIRKIFVSSTSYDLQPERKAIFTALKKISNDYIEFQPIMYEYPDTFHMQETDFINKTPYDVCLSKIKLCNYFLLLLNQRYNLRGELGNTISITHQEYRMASELRLPIFTFKSKKLDDAMHSYKTRGFQNHVDQKHIKIFEFLDEINRKDRRWIATYDTAQDIELFIKNVIARFADSKYISENPADGQIIKKGSIFHKEWTIKNNGNIPWENCYMECRVVSQDFFPVESIIKMPTVYPDEVYILKVDYKAAHEGTFESIWKMYDSQGCIMFPNYKGLWITTRIDR